MVSFPLLQRQRNIFRKVKCSGIVRGRKREMRVCVFACWGCRQGKSYDGEECGIINCSKTAGEKEP